MRYPRGSHLRLMISPSEVRSPASYRNGNFFPGLGFKVVEANVLGFFRKDLFQQGPVKARCPFREQGIRHEDHQME